jgi:hypothetical protein
MEEIIAGGANAFASYTDEEIILNMQHVRLAYQPPANSTFLS